MKRKIRSASGPSDHPRGRQQRRRRWVPLSPGLRRGGFLRNRPPPVKNGWMADIRSKRVEVALTIFSGLVIGLFLPLCLNSAAIDRENRQRCWQSVVDIRRNVNTVREGFIVQPSVPVARRADLEVMKINLENAAFACGEIRDIRRQILSIDLLITRNEAVASASDSGTFRTYADFESFKFEKQVLDWTDDLLMSLNG